MKRLSFYELTAMQTAESLAGRTIGTIKCCGCFMRQTYIHSHLPTDKDPLSYSFITLECRKCLRSIDLKCMLSHRDRHTDRIKTYIKEHKL